MAVPLNPAVERPHSLKPSSTSTREVVPQKIWPFKVSAQAGWNKGPGMWAGSGSRAIQHESCMFHGLRIPGFYLPQPFPWPRDNIQDPTGGSHPAPTLPGRGSMSLASWLWGSVLPRMWVLGFLSAEQRENQAPGGEAERPFLPEVKTESKLFLSFLV